MSTPDDSARERIEVRRRREVAVAVVLVVLSCAMAWVLLLAWQGLAEAIEPRWTLQLKGLLLPSESGIEVAVGPEDHLLLYGEPRPYVGQGAALQKGLVWEHADRLAVGTGLGMGVPMVLVGDKIYCSRMATVEFDPAATEFRLRKAFLLDTTLEAGGLLRSRYRPTEPIGEVVVTYTLLSEGAIAVEVDFRGVSADWSQAVIVNEQGAWLLRQYEDSSGVSLRGRRLRGLRQTDASQACLRSRSGDHGFCVALGAGGSLVYGREQGLACTWRGPYWVSTAGVNIWLDEPVDVYRYRLTLGTVDAAGGWVD
ncbi:MAG: hypothetical protein ABFD20_02070 [Anaerolineales bacterium]